MSSLGELHSAMGEFLTESSRVENLMLSLLIACRRDRGLEDIFTDFMSKTFGSKIVEFKRACRAYNFSPSQQQMLDSIYADLDTLLPKRNDIVHGETFEIGKDNASVQAYRIGITKGDFNYLNKFVNAGLDVPHAFSTERIKRTTAECLAVRESLGTLTNQVFSKYHP
jgi:hypothetical protein